MTGGLSGLQRSPSNVRRNSICLRREDRSRAADKMIKITCQRLNADKIYEEVEIEVPAPIFETLQATNGEGVNGRKNGLSGLGSKLKNLFIKH